MINNEDKLLLEEYVRSIKLLEKIMLTASDAKIILMGLGLFDHKLTKSIQKERSVALELLAENSRDYDNSVKYLENSESIDDCNIECIKVNLLAVKLQCEVLLDFANKVDAMVS